MMWWHDDGGHPGLWILMAVMMVVFWGAVIAVAIWAAHTVGASRSTGPAPSPAAPSRQPSRADELLAERFARGEIDEDEFNRRRAALRAG